MVIPGISHGPFGNPFDELVGEDSVTISIVRVEAWEGAEELGEMTLKLEYFYNQVFDI